MIYELTSSQVKCNELFPSKHCCKPEKMIRVKALVSIHPGITQKSYWHFSYTTQYGYKKYWKYERGREVKEQGREEQSVEKRNKGRRGQEEVEEGEEDKGRSMRRWIRRKSRLRREEGMRKRGRGKGQRRRRRKKR